MHKRTFGRVCKMSDNIYTFDEVFQTELKYIRERRSYFKSTENTKSDEDPLKEDLCGLAISGGGIRSATFGLGVLQGLAITGLLPKFDYLSTVSGGGYIGGWFSAWVHREGFQNVEKALLPPRFHNTPGNGKEIEAKPIRHLRLYSNYLAPRPGFFSFDGWVLIAIYVRNLLLNQLILFAAIIALFGAVRTVIEFFSLARDMKHGSFFLLSPLPALLLSVYGLSLFSPTKRPSSTKYTFDVSMFWILCILPWLVAALLISLIFTNPNALHWFEPVKLETNKINLLQSSIKFLWIAAAVLILGLVHGLAGWNFCSLRRRSFIAGLSSGLLGGTALFWAWYTLLSFLSLDPLTDFATRQKTEIAVAIIATFGVPMCLMIFVLTNFLMIGLCGPGIREIEREWWSSLNSRMMYISCGWLFCVGTAIFGPVLVTSGGEIIKAIIGTSWAATLLAGLRFAAGADTGKNLKGGWPEVLAHIAPILLIFGMFLLGAYMTTWLAYDLHAIFISEPQSRFYHRLDHLLTDLNSGKLKEVHGFVFWYPIGWLVLIGSSFLFIWAARILGRCVGINTFSLQNLYANRLTRCYLGASKLARCPDPIVNMDPLDDIEMSALSPGPSFEDQQVRSDEEKIDASLKMASEEAILSKIKARVRLDSKVQRIQKARAPGLNDKDCWGPLHLINGALNQKAGSFRRKSTDQEPNLAGGQTSTDKNETAIERYAENLQFLERQSESFVFSPLYSGSETTRYCRTFEFADDLKLGTAIAVLGAAVTPNMGYHSSPLITVLLTVFNVRLGAWFGNPGKPTRIKANPPASADLLLSELVGKTDAESDYVYVSDGGHFENMGVYELIRRRCRFIIAVDAGEDPKFHENVGRLVRQVRIDFGVSIDIDMTPVTPVNGICRSHVVVGRIHYGDVYKPAPDVKSTHPDDPRFSYPNNQGIIIWIKNSLTGDESGDLVNHAAMHPEFPYDTTLNQFFSEPQFESYRALGVHSVMSSLYAPCEQESVKNHNHSGSLEKCFPTSVSTREAFEKIYSHWLEIPPEFIAPYLQNNEAYARIMTTLRTNKDLKSLAIELYGGNDEKSPPVSPNPTTSFALRLIANEMFTLLENVYFSQSLESRHLHPVNEGWMKVFKHWITSPTLKAAWEDKLQDEYSPSFKRFVKNRNFEYQSEKKEPSPKEVT